MTEDVKVNERVTVPASELRFRAVRAGGPGGQHVNTSSTKVELTWNLHASAALDEAEKARVLEKLARRFDDDGNLRLTASASRSQHQNRRAVTARFGRMLEQALQVPKPRRRTRPTAASREERLRAKKRRAQVKRGRGAVRPDE